MKKVFISLVMFLAFVLVLSACNQSTDDETKGQETVETEDNATSDGIAEQTTDEEETNQEAEPETEVALKSDEEIRSIIENNLNSITTKMESIVTNYVDWQYQPWVTSPSQDQAKHEEALKVIQNELSNYYDERLLVKMAPRYLGAYFCGCGGYILPTVEDLLVRFKVEEQTEDSFKISFITLADEMGSMNPGTTYWTYKNVRNDWVFSDEEFVPVEQQPLNLTEEDIVNNYSQYNQSIIGQVTINGNQYFIVSDGGNFTFAVNTRDSTINFEIASSFMENAEDSNTVTTDGWEGEIFKIANSNLDEQVDRMEATRQVAALAREQQPSPEQIKQFENYMMEEYQTKRYSSNVNDHEYMLKNIFISMIVSIYHEEERNSMYFFADEFLSNTNSFYTLTDSPGSGTATYAEKKMDNYLSEM